MQRFRALAAGFAFLLALLALPPAALAAPAITITPQTGAAGMTFTIKGAGLDAKERPVVIVEATSDKSVAAYFQPEIGADGGFTFELESRNFAPGQYRVVVAPVATFNTIAEATFTVTGAMPRMPNTGAGGGSAGAPGAPALAGLGAVVALTGAAGVARRRWATGAGR